MDKETNTMNAQNNVYFIALIASTGVFSTTAFAKSYSHDVSFSSSTLHTTAISGFAGTAIERVASNEDHAMFGITSHERRDQPCKVTIHTESMNESTNDATTRKIDLCGGDATSSAMEVYYSDAGIRETRVFVTGIRVCTNKKSNRVKGYQMIGKLISDAGKIEDIGVERQPVTYFRGGSGSRTPQVLKGDEVYPADYRNNCAPDEWKQWASCVRSNQLAVGAILHFEAGDNPRALTGIALQCKSLSRLAALN